jgi:hypothetical protein
MQTDRHARRPASAIGSAARERLSCPCGFRGTTRNIRAHRVTCESWLAELRQQIAPVDNGADTARAIAGAMGQEVTPARTTEPK